MVLPLSSRALDILVYLASRPGEVVKKKKLIDHVWSDVLVEEVALRVHVSVIRKAIGDGQFGNRYIASVVDTKEQDHYYGSGPVRRYFAGDRPAAVRLYGDQPGRAS
jgi:Transcriptional regulatory protein, C terminal